MERPNFVLTNTCHSETYRPPRQVIPKRTVPRNPAEHSAKLTARLNEAFLQDRQRKARALRDGGGTYLEFMGPKDGELATDRLEDLKQGVRLLNVRQQDDATLATVFIPSGKEGVFLSKIRDYGDPEHKTKKGNARHEKLVSSIEDIRLAMVDSLWTGKENHRPSVSRQWLEIWLRVGKEEDAARFFEGYTSELDAIGITHKSSFLLFPERMVTLAFANKAELAKLIDSFDSLAEIKEAPLAASFFANLEPAEQRAWVDDLLSRTSFKPGKASICILDTGINDGHPLLAPVIDHNVVLSNNEAETPSDRANHGTMLAGLALYGNLKDKLASDDSIVAAHVIESVKIFDGRRQNDPELYGDIAKQAIDRSYIAKPKRNRIFCSGVTASDDEVTDGLPTSWSAALDEAISHADEPDSDHELVLIAAGNISNTMLAGTVYPDANEIRSVRSPGQSWNAITVGAYSENVHVEEEDILATGYMPVAMKGELCPYSTTSLQWKRSVAPIKPEIVCPGGNAITKDGEYSDCQDLSLLSTGANVTSRPLDTIRATSAAVAEAAYIAAEIENAYPNLWPETVRGLLIHSARWSDAMIRRYCPKGSREDTPTKGRLRLLRSCGYGIPNLRRAIECKENSVNLVIQGTLQPYEERKGKASMREMHFHRIPWPKKVLESLGDADATLHVTLSYYIEPGPGQIGWKDKYRYASHGLRFDVNKPGETWEEFERRINVGVREEDEGKSSSNSGDWFLGSNNQKIGSIHSDYKYCSAVELSEIEFVAVYPVVGWWRSRKYLGKLASRARYSLIVSIETPCVSADLYSEVVTAVKNMTPVAVPVASVEY